MKIKEQTRKLAAGCSKYCFEVVDRTDEVSNYTYGKATLTRFEFDFRRVQDPRFFLFIGYDCNSTLVILSDKDIGYIVMPLFAEIIK